MPVYVYHCDQCEYQFEQQQKFSDNPLKTCPNCGKTALHKVYMPVGVIYKGSGFYSTDHRSSSSSSTSSIPANKSSTIEKADDKPKSESDPKETKTKSKEKK